VPDTPADLLPAALRADPAGPLLTFYDDATGERVELSATTLSNWVAKTANLLQDDLGVQGGDRIGIVLPPHWQTAVALLACWAVGAEVRRRSVSEPTLLVCEAQLAEVLAAPAVPEEIVAFSLAPLGRGLSAPQPGVVDYAADVLSHGDRFSPHGRLDPSAPALDGVTGADLVAQARERARQLGLSRGGRLLVSPDTDVDEGRAGADSILDMLLAPLAAGASVVLCRNADPAALPRRAQAERVTATLGEAGGLRAPR
jgi:uncharacterized protein (TIGR03089 family)